MTNIVEQYRFYGADNPNNYPEEATMAKYIDGTIFDSRYIISQLGIQSLPGVKFYLNGSLIPITIGASGVYDLDIRNGFRVTDLSFSGGSMERINEDDSGYLIVDILRAEEE